MDKVDDQQYDQARDTCKGICGNLYFPSTMAENDEVKDVLVEIMDYHCIRSPFLSADENVWIRLVYNETEMKWKDPDNKGGCHMKPLNFDLENL